MQVIIEVLPSVQFLEKKYLVVLHRFSEQSCSYSLQFGFKAKHSTSMCTMILNEITAYYTAGGGSLYCTMLDATKAFDHVEYCKLFNCLLRRDIPRGYTFVCF